MNKHWFFFAATKRDGSKSITFHKTLELFCTFYFSDKKLLGRVIDGCQSPEVILRFFLCAVTYSSHFYMTHKDWIVGDCIWQKGERSFFMLPFFNYGRIATIYP